MATAVCVVRQSSPWRGTVAKGRERWTRSRTREARRFKAGGSSLTVAAADGTCGVLGSRRDGLGLVLNRHCDASRLVSRPQSRRSPGPARGPSSIAARCADRPQRRLCGEVAATNSGAVEKAGTAAADFTEWRAEEALPEERNSEGEGSFSETRARQRAFASRFRARAKRKAPKGSVRRRCRASRPITRGSTVTPPVAAVRSAARTRRRWTRR